MELQKFRKWLAIFLILLFASCFAGIGFGLLIRFLL